MDSDFFGYIDITEAEDISIKSSQGNKLVVDNVTIFLNGEIYKIGEIQSILWPSKDLILNKALEAYKEGQLNTFVSSLNGKFSFVIVDVELSKVSLVTDRFGLSLLYLYRDKTKLVWSDRIEKIVELVGANKLTLLTENLKLYLNVGHLLEDITWFKEISLIQPALIKSISFDSQSQQEHFYWKWGDIKPQKLNYEDAVDQLYFLFNDAVRNMINPNEKIGIALSGGLDSRLIFSSLNKIYPDYQGYSYTFGTKGCRDHMIAKEIVKKSSWKHQSFYLGSDNWLEPRMQRVLLTDGQKNIKHMHGCEFIDEIRKHMDVNLNGFLGDVVLGASYTDKSGRYDSKMTEALAHSYYHNSYKFKYINSSYFQISKIEPFLIYNRGRRFVNMGAINMSRPTVQRFPFMDNKLINFLYSLPDHFRANSKIYIDMILKYHGDFFKDIAWQKTGYPVSHKLNWLEKFSNKVGRYPVKFDLAEDRVTYSNYPKWIRQNPNRELISNILKFDSSCYKKYGLENLAQKYFVPHLSQKVTMKGYLDFSENVLRALTIEIYLRELEVKYGEFQNE